MEMPTIDEEKVKYSEPNIDDLLEIWTVDSDWENDTGPKGWFAVSNDAGIIAYFGKEADAFAFRLMKINHILNVILHY